MEIAALIFGLLFAALGLAGLVVAVSRQQERIRDLEWELDHNPRIVYVDGEHGVETSFRRNFIREENWFA